MNATTAWTIAVIAVAFAAGAFIYLKHRSELLRLLVAHEDRLKELEAWRSVVGPFLDSLGEDVAARVVAKLAESRITATPIRHNKGRR